MNRSKFLPGITLLVTGIVLAMVGCTGEGSWSSLQDGVLATTIRKDDSKQFVYRIPPRLLRGDAASNPEEKRTRDSHANDGGFNGRAMNPEESGVGRRKEDMERVLKEQAIRKLAAIGYCRHSDKFITIRINTDPLDTFLQGECQESATDDDRKRFPDTTSR
ncbi:MAG TPA: hypothetical protein PLF22_05710 [Pseudomonadales bacterium]|nr:hypothetical protein [Pseudomonadales bacterium]